MAAAYIKVYINDTCVRTFGGNLRECRELKHWYEHASHADIRRVHRTANHIHSLRVTFYRNH